MPENLDRPQPVPDPLPVNVPREIGGYRIQRVLGSGGMATVYAALQRQPRRTVALKVIKAGVASDTALRRFKREIEILGKLHHPCIAQVFDAGVHDDGGGAVPFFVMEYISGARNLLEFAAANDLALRERLKLFVKICAGVEHGHRNKIIHRDLKPGNILIDQYGEPKIIDFGIAHAAELDVSSQTMHTEAGKLVGTLQYMAPEQLEGKPVDLDARCDVYALGVLLYKLLTGKPPHDLEGLPVFEAARVIREETPAHPSEVCPELHGDLETIILKAMDHDRTRRYRNAGSLGRDVVRYLAHKPIHGERANIVHRARLFARRNRTMLLVSAIVTLTMGIAASIVLVDRARPRRDQSAMQAQLEHERRERERVEQAMRERDSRPIASPGAPREPFVLSAHSTRITSLAFSPAGNVLASASHDHSVILWDVAERTIVHRIAEFSSPVSHIVFNGDGSLVAAAAGEEPILVIDTGTGKALRTIRHNCGALHSLALDSAGGRVAFGCNDFTARLWLSGEGHVGTTRSTSGLLTYLAFSPDGRLLAAGSQRDVVYVGDPLVAGAARRFADLRGEVLAVAFVDDGRRVGAVASNGDVMIWPIKPAGEGEQVVEALRFHVQMPQPNAVAFDFSGRWLAVADQRSASVWNVLSAKRIGRGTPLPGVPYGIAIDAGQWLAIGDAEGNVRVTPLRHE